MLDGGGATNHRLKVWIVATDPYVSGKQNVTIYVIAVSQLYTDCGCRNVSCHFHLQNHLLMCNLKRRSFCESLSEAESYAKKLEWHEFPIIAMCPRPSFSIKVNLLNLLYCSPTLRRRSRWTLQSKAPGRGTIQWEN